MEWTAHFSIVIVVMLCSCIDDSFTSYCVTELSPEQRATVQELDTQQRREQRTQPEVLDHEAAQRREQRTQPVV